MITMVELMASIPPRTIESISLNPRADPARYPMTIMPMTSMRQVIMAVEPILAILCKLNSSPRWNMMNIIPISDQVSMLSPSEIVLNQGKCGDIRNPASIYPRTRGCFILLNTMAMMPAVSIIMARSLIMAGICILIRHFLFLCLLQNQFIILPSVISITF